MSIRTRIAATALVALAATGSVASSITPAEAHGPGLGLGWGVGAGLVGAAIVGSAVAATTPYPYYTGYRRCGWVRQFDQFGNYIGRINTCY